MAWYSIKSVSLSPPHFKWATTRMRSRASLYCVFSTLMCFLNERRKSHHSPRSFVDSSTGRSVFPILTVGGLWARDRGAVKCTTLHLCAANLKPFLVAHSCMAFTACCRCLSMVSRECPRKQIARSTTKCALKMSLGKQEGSSLILSPKHVTARTPPVGTPSSGKIRQRVLSQFWLGFFGGPSFGFNRWRLLPCTNIPDLCHLLDIGVNQGF